MKTLIAISAFFFFVQVQASCDVELSESISRGQSTLVIIFDGFGTNEMGTQFVERRFVETFKSQCPKLAVVNFSYKARGIERAFRCYQQFKKAHGTNFSVNLIGHSFGAGYGVVNLSKRIAQAHGQMDNLIFFDARDLKTDFKFLRSGNTTLYDLRKIRLSVKKIINILQRRGLRGYKIRGAHFEQDVTGQSSHLALPSRLSTLARRQMIASLSCARLI